MAYELKRWRPHPRARYLPGIVVVVIEAGPKFSLVRWQEPGLLYEFGQYVPDDARPNKYGRIRNQPKPVTLFRERRPWH